MPGFPCPESETFSAAAENLAKKRRKIGKFPEFNRYAECGPLNSVSYVVSCPIDFQLIFPIDQQMASMPGFPCPESETFPAAAENLAKKRRKIGKFPEFNRYAECGPLDSVSYVVPVQLISCRVRSARFGLLRRACPIDFGAPKRQIFQRRLAFHDFSPSLPVEALMTSALPARQPSRSARIC